MTSKRVIHAFTDCFYPYTGEKEPLIKALAKVVDAAEEHVECDPETIGNECVGLGGADGLIESLKELERALKEIGL